MVVVPIKLRPTFPLDAQRIKRLKEITIWGSMKLLAIRTAATLAEPLRPKSGPLASIVLRWQQLDTELTAAVVQKLIYDSNLEQDRRIRSMVHNLEQSGKYQYSISLGKFLLLKQHIERELHRRGELSERKLEIEKLVDSIAQEVCNEIHGIANLDDAMAQILTSNNHNELNAMSDKVNAAHARIMHAYATLTETAEQLPASSAIRQSSQGRGNKIDDMPVLDRLIENLKEENQLTKTVNERIQRELPRDTT